MKAVRRFGGIKSFGKGFRLLFEEHLGHFCHLYFFGGWESFFEGGFRQFLRKTSRFEGFLSRF